VSEELKQGDKVQWESSQGTIAGTVKKKLTEPTDIKGHHVAASTEEPQYLVESDKTGKEAAHKPESLKSRED
jgi:Hypervirulence associated proteins TUDOR domain